MNLRRSLSALLLALAGPVAWAQLPQPAFKVNYETASRSASESGARAAAPKAADAITVDCTVARSGQCSLRSHTQVSDDYISAGKVRAESETMGARETLYNVGDHLLYTFSARLSPDWVTGERADISAIWQFKRMSSGPDMFIAVKGDQLVLRIGPKAQLNLGKPVPRGTWIDFRIDVRWSDKADGRVEASATDTATGSVTTARYEGPTMRNARRDSGYLKWGLYEPTLLHKRGSVERSSTVWHDDIAVYRLN